MARGLRNSDLRRGKKRISVSYMHTTTTSHLRWDPTRCGPFRHPVNPVNNPVNFVQLTPQGQGFTLRAFHLPSPHVCPSGSIKHPFFGTKPHFHRFLWKKPRCAPASRAARGIPTHGPPLVPEEGAVPVTRGGGLRAAGPPPGAPKPP